MPSCITGSTSVGRSARPVTRDGPLATRGRSTARGAPRRAEWSGSVGVPVGRASGRTGSTVTGAESEFAMKHSRCASAWRASARSRSASSCSVTSGRSVIAMNRPAPSPSTSSSPSTPHVIPVTTTPEVAATWRYESTWHSASAPSRRVSGFHFESSPRKGRAAEAWISPTAASWITTERS